MTDTIDSNFASGAQGLRGQVNDFAALMGSLTVFRVVDPRFDPMLYAWLQALTRAVDGGTVNPELFRRGSDLTDPAWNGMTGRLEAGLIVFYGPNAAEVAKGVVALGGHIGMIDGADGYDPVSMSTTYTELIELRAKKKAAVSDVRASAADKAGKGGLYRPIQEGERDILRQIIDRDLSPLYLMEAPFAQRLQRATGNNRAEYDINPLRDLTDLVTALDLRTKNKGVSLR